MTFISKRRARHVSPPFGRRPRQWLINLEVRYISILRSTTKNLLKLSVTTQNTHHNYQTWKLGRHTGRECPL